MKKERSGGSKHEETKRARQEDASPFFILGPGARGNQVEVLPLRHREPRLALLGGRNGFPPDRHAVLQPPVEPRERLQQRRERSVFFRLYTRESGTRVRKQPN